jgi:23S rRNA G2445 N2-methylase RlmL
LPERVYTTKEIAKQKEIDSEREKRTAAEAEAEAEADAKRVAEFQQSEIVRLSIQNALQNARRASRRGW